MKNRGLFSPPVLGHLAVLLTLTCVACDESSPTEPDPDPTETDQTVLFHLGYENQAWGPVSLGIYVDSDGTVWAMSSSVPWNHEVFSLLSETKPDSTYTQAELEAAYETRQDSVLAVIPISEVREKYLLVEAVAQATYSEPEWTMTDVGLAVTGALLFDPEHREYRKIVVGIWGDATVSSLSPAAAELDAWLKAIWSIPESLEHGEG